MKTQLLKKLMMVATFFAAITMTAQVDGIADLWDFDTSAQNWTANTNLTTPDGDPIPWEETIGVDGGIRVNRASNNASIRLSGGETVDATTKNYVKIVIKNSSNATEFRIILPGQSLTGNGVHRKDFQNSLTTNDTGFKTYYFDLTTGLTQWDSDNEEVILYFRRDIVAGDFIEIESIEFVAAAPVVTEPVITIVDVQQIGTNPVSTGDTASFEITYKTDGSGPDITGNTWRLYQGGGVTAGFSSIDYNQTNGASQTVQVTSTWPAGYSTGVYDIRLFNAGDKTDFDWAATGHTPAVNSNLDPAEGLLGIDVNVNVVAPVIPSSEFVTNPDFEDASGISHYTGNQSEMSRSISTTEFQSGANSMQFEFTGNASKMNWLFTAANGQGVYSPAFNPATTIDITLWVKKTTNYDRFVEIVVKPNLILGGDNSQVSNQQIITTAQANGNGMWEQLSYSITTDGSVGFDEANFWIAVAWQDTDPNLTNALVGDMIFIDNIEVTITNGTLGVNDISKDDASVRLFPNPASSVLNIEADGRNISNIEVYSILGKRVLSAKNTNSINVSTLSRGVYITKIFGDDSSVSTKRFVKE